MNPPDYFIPNRDPRTRVAYPLRDSGSVRALPISVAEKYIDAFTAPGDLVIDTFGALPNVARAALNLGRRAIVIDPNPLWAWLSKSMASLPTEAEINAAFAKLGDALKDDAPLRVHIHQLYATTCAACEKSTPADYFIRMRDGGIIQRHYTCAHCGQTRDDPATEDDLKRANTFDAHGLHYHVAFQRVVPTDNSHGDRIRKMLDVYTPRNLYALVTLTQKIDALFREPRERNILLLLLLHVLDRGTSFYPAPDASAQLKTHKQFVEFNLWREMELAVKNLVSDGETFLGVYPDEGRTQGDSLAESVADVLGSPSVEMFVGHGSAKALGQRVPPQSVSLVLTTLPSRRLSVWALSYLWGAWLLGRDTAQPLAAFLDVKKNIQWERRWYFDILVQAFNGFGKMLKLDGRVVCVFDSSWHQVIEMLLLAAAGTGFSLDTFLFQPRLGAVAHSEFDDIHGDYRVTFSKNFNPIGVKPVKQIEKEIQQAALEASSDILARRGEPLAFSWVHHAAYVRAMRDGLLAEIVKAKPKAPLGQIAHQAVKAGLSEGYAHDFDHYKSAEQFLWLRRSRDLALPLIDRVEDAVRSLSLRAAERREISEPLGEISRSARNDIEDAIYRQFPGDLTPEAGLVELCAASMRTDETEKARAMEMLGKLGEKLGYVAKSEWRIANGIGQIANGKSSDFAISHKPYAISQFDVAWLANGEIAHAFIWRDRAQFADLAQIHIAPARGYLVVPEALVELMREKTRRLPHLADAFHEAGWNFVRVPFVDKLLNAETVEPADLVLMAGLTPPVAEDKTQLELL